VSSRLAPALLRFPSDISHPTITDYPRLYNAELATIVHDPEAHHAPTSAQLEAWDDSRRQSIAHQLALQLESGRSRGGKEDEHRAAAAQHDATAMQKRADREARRRRLAEAAAAAGEGGEGEGVADAAAAGATREDAPVAPMPTQMQKESPAPERASASPAGVPTSTGAVYTVSVPTTSDEFAWYDAAAAAHRYETLDAARAANVWSYPATPEDRARCEVFRDLWEKGYYMGGGSKFGGDWIVYPGMVLFGRFLAGSGFL
jgi:tRNA-splicing endonuclease subunit Sen34